MTQEYEKLGAFYLGREVEPSSGEAIGETVLYNSRDLSTHAVIIGMTGSGKTGLGISLLEEAAMDRIPVIAIDPKGDLANLLLTFPDLSPADFRPWINEATARQKGLTPDAFAAAEAESWRKGLADWEQDGERIRTLRTQVDLAVYTPGSAAARQVSVLGSFEAPPPALLADPDGLRDRIQGNVAALLGLLGIEADSIRSREYILLSAILDEAWRRGQSLDLGGLIGAIQQPPFTRLGVMELESFYPSKERFELAMQLNALLASPGFQGWMEGEALDLPAMLYTSDGKPRVSIFSIAHLGDAERMFFVTMLLSAVTAWMRTQPGTDSLRALVYMDEIFGFFPPVANPPSKGPMLTLLKQARAFGVGLVLATQNPVDLDYKGLGNTGTWFIGRLQTDRDKERVLEAMDGAMSGANSMSRTELDQLISGLGKRVFLLHNVHRGAPRLFGTRWAMSYLSGPMTLTQLKAFRPAGYAEESPSRVSAGAPPTAAKGAELTATSRAATAGTSAQRPMLPPEITQLFAPTARPAGAILYRPAVLSEVEVRYSSAKHDVEQTRTTSVLVPLEGGAVPFSTESAEAVGLTLDLLDQQPLPGASFATIPAEAARPRSYARWGKELTRWIQGSMPITLLESKVHKVSSHPDESERDFRMRLADLGREARDAEAERLREKYGSRFEALQERLRRAEQDVEKREARSQQAMLSTGLSALGAVIGAVTGRGRKSSGVLGAFLGAGRGRAATAVRGLGRAARSRQDIAHAEETVEAVREQLGDLEQEFEVELKEVQRTADAEESLETILIRPALNAMSVRGVVLVWLPSADGESGSHTPLWR